ncbi:MAG: tetratricopeptide repeat protein [Magnetococcus sp. DMHC-8]
MASLQSAENRRRTQEQPETPSGVPVDHNPGDAWTFPLDDRSAIPTSAAILPVSSRNLFQEDDATDAALPSGIGQVIQPVAMPAPARSVAEPLTTPRTTPEPDRADPSGHSGILPTASPSSGKPGSPDDEVRFNDNVRRLMVPDRPVGKRRFHNPTLVGGGVLLLLGCASAGYLLNTLLEPSEGTFNTNAPPPVGSTARLNAVPAQPTGTQAYPTTPSVATGEPLPPATPATRSLPVKEPDTGRSAVQEERKGTVVAPMPSVSMPPAPTGAAPTAPTRAATITPTGAAPAVTAPTPPATVTATPGMAPAPPVMPASPPVALPQPAVSPAPPADPTPGKSAPAAVAVPEPKEKGSPPTNRPGPGMATRRGAPPPGERLLDKAAQAFHRGELDEAERLFRAILQDSPHNHQAMIGVASVNLRRGDTGEARFWYQRLLREDPNNSLALAALLGLNGSGDAAAAESRLKHLLHAHPDAGHLHFALGNIYAAQQRWALAYGAYADANHLSREGNPEVLLNLAASLDHLHRRSEALAYYHKALALVEHGPGQVNFDVEAVRRRVEALSAQGGRSP